MIEVLQKKKVLKPALGRVFAIHNKNRLVNRNVPFIIKNKKSYLGTMRYGTEVRFFPFTALGRLWLFFFFFVKVHVQFILRFYLKGTT
ncbi:hypothetical protein CVD28_10905 [Bacillus sp. M6-12]|nr:hypothetical protein CVD28_10905 [Bacillus sp. M6-12]